MTIYELAIVLLLATSCASQPLPALAGGGCRGRPPEHVKGARSVDDRELHALAVRPEGQGGMCLAKIFEAVQPITVYRAWTPGTNEERGQWWALGPPAGTRSEYRKTYAICSEWNALEKLSRCVIPPGTRFAVGPGQSALCEQESFEASEINQVFVPKDPLTGAVPVDGCRSLAWPDHSIQ